MRRLALIVLCTACIAAPSLAQDSVKKDVKPQQTTRPAPPPDPDQLGTPVNTGSTAKPNRQKKDSAKVATSEEASVEKKADSKKPKSAEMTKSAAKK